MDPGSSNLYAELFKTFGMLAIVLGILLGTLYFVKKFMAKKFFAAEGAKIKLLSSFYLGSREKLVMIDVEGEKLLIGVTRENISLITKLGRTNDVLEKEESQPEFAEIFKKSIKNKFFLKKEKKEENGGK